MDDATNNNTLQPSLCGARKRNTSVTSDHQADIKRAKKAEYNKRYREKQASLVKDTFFVHMAQKIISRQRHNMLHLLHAACLKLLVFFRTFEAIPRPLNVNVCFSFSYPVQAILFHQSAKENKSTVCILRRHVVGHCEDRVTNLSTYTYRFESEFAAREISSAAAAAATGT